MIKIFMKQSEDFLIPVPTSTSTINKISVRKQKNNMLLKYAMHQFSFRMLQLYALLFFTYFALKLLSLKIRKKFNNRYRLKHMSGINMINIVFHNIFELLVFLCKL